MNIRKAFSELLSPLHAHAQQALQGGDFVVMVERSFLRIASTQIADKYFNGDIQKYHEYARTVDDRTADIHQPQYLAEMKYRSLYGEVSQRAGNLEFEKLLDSLEECADFLKEEFGVNPDTFLFTFSNELHQYIESSREIIKEGNDPEVARAVMAAAGIPPESDTVATVIEFSPRGKKR